MFVIFARTNQGKSWVLEKICTHIWQLGFNVGYISPEMGPSSIGYRFDTLYNNFNNSGLMWGNSGVDDNEYKKYIDELVTNDKHFIVSTPDDFQKRITITKLKNWIKKFNLDAIAIDGITYLSDERYKRGDNKTTSLTNISEDLMSLSIEMNVPVLVVVQANRGGVVDKDSQDMPELESMRDSDGIAFNASTVLSVRQKDNILMIQSKKQRIGSVGKKVSYIWNANVGEFIYTKADEELPMKEVPKERQSRKKTVEKKEDVF